MFDQMLAVAWRVLRQLARDRRFLGLSLFVPLLITYMLYVFFEGVKNPFVKPREFILPMGAFMVHFITYLLCTIVLVRERTAHTLARMFVNGYTRGSVIGGYMLSYSLLATLQTLIVLVALYGLFKLDYDWQTLLAIYGVTWLLAVISIALGILVSNFARNEGQIFPFVPLVTLPSLFFSGLIVPVSSLPQWMGALAYIAPLYYATEAIRGLTGQKGDVSQWAGLLIYGAIVFVLATFTLREQE
jgi:ABC-2 type transport system permease protein